MPVSLSLPTLRHRHLAAGAAFAAAASLAACGAEATNADLDWVKRSRPRADSVAATPAAPTAAGTATAVSLSLSRRDTALLVGARLAVGVVVRDSAGRQLYDRPNAWASSDSTVLAVEGLGDVRELRALRAGEATVTVTLGALRQALRVVVQPAPPPGVAGVTLSRDSVIPLGDSVLVRVEARDSLGRQIVVTDRRVWWSTDIGPGVPLVLGSAVGAPDSTRVAARWVRGVAVGLGRVAVAVDGQLASALFRVAGPAPAPVPRAARIALAVAPTTIVAGGSAAVTATALDSLGQPVVDAGVRLQSANPGAGIVTQDSVGTGERAGTVFGTLHALTPGIFSVTAETRDRGVLAQTVVTVTRP